MYFARLIENLLGPKNKVARWLGVAESAVSRYLDSLLERWQVDRQNAGAADPMGGFRSLASVPEFATAAPSIALPHRLRSAVVERKNPRPS
jgi:hypothetical protein